MSDHVAGAAQLRPELGDLARVERRRAPSARRCAAASTTASAASSSARPAATDDRVADLQRWSAAHEARVGDVEVEQEAGHRRARRLEEAGGDLGSAADREALGGREEAIAASALLVKAQQRVPTQRDVDGLEPGQDDLRHVHGLLLAGAELQDHVEVDRLHLGDLDRELAELARLAAVRQLHRKHARLDALERQAGLDHVGHVPAVVRHLRRELLHVGIVLDKRLVDGAHERGRREAVVTELDVVAFHVDPVVLDRTRRLAAGREVHLVVVRPDLERSTLAAKRTRLRPRARRRQRHEAEAVLETRRRRHDAASSSAARPTRTALRSCELVRASETGTTDSEPRRRSTAAPAHAVSRRTQSTAQSGRRAGQRRVAAL